MSSSDPPSTAGTGNRGFFPRTRWSLVLRMQDPEVTQIAANALDELCQMYWQPVYAYIRSWSKSPADAEDLTQGFFAMLLSRQSLDAVAPERGKLRTFLLVALKRFLANEHERENALKRGGGEKPISVDLEWTDGGPQIEPAGGQSPDQLFDRQWALTVLDRVFRQLRERYAANRKEAVFDALSFTISVAASRRPLSEVAEELGISESAAKVASHRLRQRYQEILREIIAETVDSEEDVRVEIGHLMLAFSSR